ncbi:MAG: hypothetical protein QM516_02315 [Limnohabitans sp.]|nr:hypothetical protein [Limnohabitans sp.]
MSGESWQSLRIFGRELASWRAESRSALGLPTDRFLVMTGHQAGIWHAGIAEKFIVGAQLAAEHGGILVHVVVDHDLNDASLVAFPALTAGKLARLTLERSPRGTRTNIPNALRKPIRTMRPERAHEVPETLEPALAAIEHAIAEGRDRENLAMQMASAANALILPHARIDHTVAATAFAALPFAVAMRKHFASMRDAYNAAVTNERIAPLGPTELPFWKLDRATLSRAPMLEGETEHDALTLAPRALTLTLIARLVLCDIFIHGTGGGRYDHAMEQWLGEALGADARSALAPMMVATATKYAPLTPFVPAFDASATPEALRVLEQDPFGDDGRTKAALRAKITGTHAEKRAAFITMRRQIVEARATRAHEISELRARVSANRDANAAHTLAMDRTWPFPFSMGFSMEAI